MKVQPDTHVIETEYHAMTQTQPNAYFAFGIIACSTVLGLVGIDLVLPAIPSLPEALDGTPAQAQFVLASFVAGTGCGLLAFGELGARYDQRVLLALSLITYGLFSAVASLAGTLDNLIIIRFIQGFSSSAAAVFAPGMIRMLFDEQRAIRAIGVLGSIESLAPALAPVAGALLLTLFDWRSSFLVTAALAVVLGLAVVRYQAILPPAQPVARHADYKSLMLNAVFLRYALSQALTLGALLVFVFGAPAVITRTMGGSLSDFILMQVTGIAGFITAANLADRLVVRFSAEKVIFGGSALSLAGIVSIFVYAAFGGGDPAMLILLFLPMNLGLGLRGPPGFLLAVLAAQGDDARGAALVILSVLLTTAIGTAINAPLITYGLIPLAAIAAAISVAGMACLLLPHRLNQAESSSGPA